jgi:heme o synthase
MNTKIMALFELMKPRVMRLVLFTAVIGMVMAPGHIGKNEIILAFCIALAAGSAGSMNMIIERNLDALMPRTANRPIPSGRVTLSEAIILSVLSCITSLYVSYTLNPLVFIVLISIFIIYIPIYTIWLKPRTPQNIVWGGLSGALPPLAGYVAVTSYISLEPILWVMIIFFWTPPHFWALSIWKSDDYNEKFPMYPNVYGIRSTQIAIAVYTFVMFVSSILPLVFRFNGCIYFFGILYSNTRFGTSVYNLYKDEKHAQKTFLDSLKYLMCVFLFLLIDKLCGNYQIYKYHG